MPKSGLGVLTLASGQVWTAERVKSFKAPEDASVAFAYLMEPEKKADAKPEAKADDSKPAAADDAAKKKEKKKDPGTPLIVRQLATGAEQTVADVTDYAWSKDGRWLGYAVSSKDSKADGAFLRRATDGTTRTLASGLGHYKGLAFDEAGRQVAFVTDRDDYQARPSTYALLVGRTDGAAAPAAVPLRGAAALPADFVVSEHGALEFSKDGARLFFGTAPKPDPEPEPDVALETVAVDLWHWQDERLQPMQKVTADEDRKQSYRAVLHVASGRVTQLASLDAPRVSLSDQGSVALAFVDAPYRQLTSWDGRYEDLAIVDLATGKSRTLAENVHFGGTLSPGGQYVLYFDQRERAWFTARVSDGRKANLTGALKVSFTEEDADTPEAPQPYGFAGWTEGDRSVLLYDRFDIWEAKPDGGEPRMITGGAGRAAEIAFRYVTLDPKAPAIAANEPWLLSAVDSRTKAGGFYRLDPRAASASASASAAPVKLLMQDKAAGVPIKARSADRLVVTFSRFEEFPNLWVTNAAFAKPEKVSDANPQQAQYTWGRSELITYRNADGKTLSAILTKPDDFDPAKKYPLLVYIYEQLTNNLHRYVPPAPSHSINVSRYVSNGYVVLQPDIVYDTGYPGESALKCVLPAVQTVLDKGFIDPARVGIQGHSWGGYQNLYLVTHTNIFRAVEAGAPVVDMISAYGGIRWGTGMSRAFQYEKTQSRIGGAPWNKPLQFIENSPLFWLEKIQTPVLVLHNDDDDAVPWYQGIEFITAMRRLQKEAYLFSYNGEKHGLRQRETQKHYTVHMAEFFDHYLKGAPRPEWMEKGVPYLKKGTRDLTPFYGKSTDDEDR
jgi:dipeptidyl aminopeptidase/acylaminoacyl peptidase